MGQQVASNTRQRDLLVVDSVLAINMNTVVSCHTSLTSSNTLGSVEIIPLLRAVARGAAHLATLVESGGTVACCSRRRASTELAVNQVVMSIVAPVGDSGVVSDACPDG